MKTDAWLKVSGKVQPHGQVWPGPISISKNKPKVSAGSILVKLSIDVPDSYFLDPKVEVNLTLPEPVQDIGVIANIARDTAAELSKQTGFSINVSIPSEQRP